MLERLTVIDLTLVSCLVYLAPPTIPILNKGKQTDSQLSVGYCIPQRSMQKIL